MFISRRPIGSPVQVDRPQFEERKHKGGRGILLELWVRANIDHLVLLSSDRISPCLCGWCLWLNEDSRICLWSVMWSVICFTEYSWDVRFSLPYCPLLDPLIWTRIAMNWFVIQPFSLKFFIRWFSVIELSLPRIHHWISSYSVHISKNRQATSSHRGFIRILSLTLFSLPYAHY